MVISKLNLVIIASFAGAVLWIEHGNHVNLETAPPAGISGPAATVCPENESVPHSADCFAFQGDVASDVRERMNTAGMPAPARSPATPARGPACPPNNENVPYSASCLRFLSGPDWHPADVEP